MKTLSRYLREERSIEKYLDEFESAVQSTHKKEKFGDTVLFSPIEPSLENSLLITAGVQGDEPAGWVALRRWAKTGKIPNNVFVIPVMSFESFENETHYDDEGQNVNHDIPKDPSDEMKNIIDKKDELRKMSKNGFLSLQEDPNRSEGYLFVWKDNSGIAKNLLEIMKSHFSIYEDGIIGLEDDQGMFGEYAVRTLDTPNAFTTETQVLENSLSKRVQAQVEMIQEFVRRLS